VLKGKVCEHALDFVIHPGQAMQCRIPAIRDGCNDKTIRRKEFDGRHVSTAPFRLLSLKSWHSLTFTKGEVRILAPVVAKRNAFIGKLRKFFYLNEC
jgi:hypothetical protein